MAINFDGKGNIEATTPDGVIAVKLYSLEKTIEQKDKEIKRLNNIIGEATDRAIHIQKTFGYVLDDLIYLLMQGSDK